MRVASVRAARRKLVKLFKKPNSKFYWYDFTVRGHRYRGSTQETKTVRAVKAASLKLALVLEGTDPLPSKPTAICEFAVRFIAWVDDSRLEEKTKKFYRNGWRLLKATSVLETRVNQITADCAEQLKFPGSAANANCALRTLRRMLHKAEEWKMIGHAPKIKMMKEHGRHLRLDDEAERKLLEGAQACTWRRQTFELFRDIVILMRDTGMRNQRELYRMRIENLDWQNRIIFVPDSKTAEGRRLVPMSCRVSDLLRATLWYKERGGGCFHPAVPLLGTCVQSTASSGRRADKRAFPRTSFYIVPGMTTAQGSSCGPGTWPPSGPECGLLRSLT
jgi:hypothetical protein